LKLNRLSRILSLFNSVGCVLYRSMLSIKALL